MDFSDYQKNAARTCASLNDIRLDLAHMVLGIHSEYNEFLDAVDNKDFVNVSEELADMIWYIANYCNFRGYSLAEINKDKKSKTIPYISAQLQDSVKKFVAYGKEIDREEEQNLLSELLSSINNFYYEYQLDIHRSLENNINKLKVRYPEKFTSENAIQRNLTQERKELERQ